MNKSPTLPEPRAGDRFLLRPWRLSAEDLALVREAADDDYIPRLTTVPAPYSDEAGREFITRQQRRMASSEAWPLVIVRAADERPIGVMSVRGHERDQGRASVGYWVVGSARGQGAATAALRTATDWALTELGISRVELYAEPWNTGSLRTAEAAGYLREGLLRSWQVIGDRRRDMYMYSRVAQASDV